MNIVARFLGIVLLIVSAFPLSAQTISLISQSEIERFGLKRVWFHQLKLQSSKAKIQHALIEGGQLFLTTSDAKLHVLDSETGQWLWTRSIGTRSIALTEPAVNSRIAAVHNNLDVFLFNRYTGKQLLQFSLSESAAGPCEMSEHYLYIPLVNDTIRTFPLREGQQPQEIILPDTGKPLQKLPDYADPELKKIIQQFEETKKLLKAEQPPEVNLDNFVVDSTHRIAMICPSMGTVRTKPLLLSQFYNWKLDEEEQPTHEVDKETHEEYLAWVTDEGFMYTAITESLSENVMSVMYRIDSAGQTFFMNSNRGTQVDRPGNKTLPTRPVSSQHYPINAAGFENLIVPDIAVTGGRASYVFAINARTGKVRWQFPAQGQLLESLAVVGWDVYAPTSTGGLHALDLDTGKERWFAQNIKKFVAASKKRSYFLDLRDRLVCLDRESGETIFVYDTRRFDICLFNMETDQIFLMSEEGLVQCLRERQFAEADEHPLRHRISSAEFAEAVRNNTVPKLWWIEEKMPEVQKPDQSGSGTE